MVKTHEIQGIQTLLSCTFCAGVFRSLLKKSSVVFSVFMMMACPVFADAPAGYREVPFEEFPAMTEGVMTAENYMQPKIVYKNAAVAANMLGLTKGTIDAVPVYMTVSCSENQYLDANTCKNCPSDYPKSNGGSGGYELCYKIVTRGCTQNACTCPDNSACVCDTCSCDAETYKKHTNGATDGETANETCNQTVATITCNTGYHKNQETNATSCVAEKYRIKYNLNAGTNSANNPENYTIETDTITLGIPTRIGHAFGGWYDNSGLTGAAVTEIAKGATGDKEYWAKWTLASFSCPAGKYLPKDSTECVQCLENNYCEANGYEYSTTQDQGLTACHVAFTRTGTETCNIDHATGSTKAYTQTCYHNESIAGSTSATACTGDADCETKNYETCYVGTCDTGYRKNQETNATSCVAETYRIKYNLNGGTNSANNPENYTIEKDTITLATPTKKGYAFGGWYDNPGLTGTAVIKVAKGSTGDKEYWAKWTLASFSCPAGKYLPKDSTECVQCLENNYCEANGYEYSTTQDQGLTACHVAFTSTGTETCSVAHATGATRNYTQTCYHNRSIAGSVSSDACTGVVDCETKNYEACIVTGCAAGYYLLNGACVEVGIGYYSADGMTDRTKCPDAYPNTASATAATVTECYKTVKRACTQKTCTCQGDSSCTCAACQCAGETYIQYVAANGQTDGAVSGDTTNETCNQTVETTTCNAGYYMKNNVCTACPKGTYKATAGNDTGCTVASDGYYVSVKGATSQTQCPADYREGSNRGRDDITDCYKLVTRACVQKACTCQKDSTCTCADCECAGGTYIQYVASDGVSYGATSGTTLNETCTQSVAVTTCKAGYYMKNEVCTACPKGTYKATAGSTASCTLASEDYYVSITGATSQTSCPTGLVSPQGTTSAGGCGKMMYVDGARLYLTSEKQTSPALAVRIDGRVYYAKTSPLSVGAKPMNNTTTKSLRTKINGVEYSIHDNTVQEE